MGNNFNVFFEMFIDIPIINSEFIIIIKLDR